MQKSFDHPVVVERCAGVLLVQRGFEVRRVPVDEFQERPFDLHGGRIGRRRQT